MLPGFRFLFAAIVLSISLLIFGLGAAALLRAAHQEFASLPSRPAPREPVFASQNDAPIPALAMLRIDDQTAAAETPQPAATDNVAAAAASESSPIVATVQPAAAEPDNLAVPAALRSEEQNLAEVPPSETAARTEPHATADEPLAPEAPAAEGARNLEAPSPAEATLAAPEIVEPPAANPATPANPEQASPVTPTADAVETKIATRGDPAVNIEPQTSPIKAKQKSRDSAVKKRVRAERAIKRRKAARRASARRAFRAPADPFGAQPFSGFPGASRTQ